MCVVFIEEMKYTSTVNSVGGGLLPPPEAPDGLPEFPRG